MLPFLRIDQIVELTGDSRDGRGWMPQVLINTKETFSDKAARLISAWVAKNVGDKVHTVGI